ncbi:MAG: hypothetical protein FWB91_13850 [Defluviitaleaceae bacterium]|nr:hypothetical protein [Defluviitaleaceae bacterium]
MNIGNIQSNNTNSSNVFNVGNIRTQMQTAQANRGRTPLRLPAEITQDTLMQPVTNATHWNERTNVNARLDSIMQGNGNYSTLSDSDMSRLVRGAADAIRTPSFGEQNRSIAEMANFLEQKLNEIENDESLSPERRDVLRQIWQEGMVMAVQGNHTPNVPAVFSGLDIDVINGRWQIAATREEAEATVREAIGHAHEIATNISSITANAEIQNLILQGLEESITRAILFSASQYYLHNRSQGMGETAASNATSAFRREATELFSTLRNEWGSPSRPTTGVTRELFNSLGM